MMKPTVFIVDDDQKVREALRMMLQSKEFDVEVYAGAKAFLEGFRPSRSGCLLLDVRMPEMDGLQLQAAIGKKGFTIPIVFLSGHGDIPLAVRTVQAGAVTFLEKPADAGVLRQAIAKALEIDAAVRRRQLERAEILEGLAQLTPREREVLELLVQGKRTSTIAKVLGSQPATVRVQRAAILRKMRADTVTDLARLTAMLHEGNQGPAGTIQKNPCV